MLANLLRLQPTFYPEETSNAPCNPLINIHETQSSTGAINSPGNSDLVDAAPKSSTRYAQNTPGPPFHVSNINSVGMHTRNTGFIESQMSARGISTTILQPDFASGGFGMHDGSEMDLSGGERSVDHSSPATISSQSRGGSMSQSSYSPSQQNEMHIPYRESPKVSYSGLASGGTTGFSGFVSTSEALPIHAFSNGLMVGDEWDYAALNAETGFTTADTSWDPLESVTMGWGVTGHFHDIQTNLFGAG